MSPKKATAKSDVESGFAAFVDELLNTGTTVIQAPTREHLAEMVDEIPADVKYSVGAVGHNLETGAFTLRIDLLKT